jgi:hypothetical protein
MSVKTARIAQRTKMSRLYVMALMIRCSTGAQQRVPIMGPDGTLVMAGIQGIQLLSPRLARLDSVVAT